MMHGVKTEVDATWIAIIMVQILIAAVSLLRKATLACYTNDDYGFHKHTFR